MESEMKKLSTPAKKKKYPNPKQRVAIGLNVCGLSKYDKGGLIAPNGKKSNLNAEQYKLVRTPAFKQWFGDWENSPETASKVVDENGEPLVVYHGTKSSDIYEFDLSKSKRISSGLKEFGTYFTDNKKLAESYRDWSSLKEEEKTNIDIEINKWKEFLYATRNNRDYDYAEQQIKILNDLKKGKIYSVFLNLKKMYSFDAKKEINIEAWNNLEVKASYKLAKNRDAMDFLKDGKFGVEKVDGIQAKNIVDAFVQTEELKKQLLSNVYLVFDSKNIKLADGSNTKFDANNPDIRFDEGGKVKTDRSGNYIGDGKYHVKYSTFDFSEYPQIDTNVSLSETTESVYVTYKNNDNDKSITLRFSTHENNAVKFGDQLDGNIASKNEILYKLGLMNRKFIPKKRFSIRWSQPKKIDLHKYEIADKTMKELYDMGEGADISMYKGKLAKDSNYLITGDVVESFIESKKDFLGNEVQVGDYIYESFEQGGIIEKNNWGLNNLIYWWK
jgi:hypothetical protein